MNTGKPDYKPLPHIQWPLLEGSYNDGLLALKFEYSFFQCEQLQARKVSVACQSENWSSHGILVNAHIAERSIADPYDTSSFIYTIESIMDDYLLLFDASVSHSRPVGPAQGYPPGSTKTEAFGRHFLRTCISVGRSDEHVGPITLTGQFIDTTGKEFQIKWTKD